MRLRDYYSILIPLLVRKAFRTASITGNKVAASSSLHSLMSRHTRRTEGLSLCGPSSKSSLASILSARATLNKVLSFGFPRVHDCSVRRSRLMAVSCSSNRRAVLDLGNSRWLAARNCSVECCLHHNNIAFLKEKQRFHVENGNVSIHHSMLAFRFQSFCGLCALKLFFWFHSFSRVV